MRGVWRQVRAVVSGLLLMVAACAAGAPDLRVDQTGRIPLAGHLAVLPDPGGRLTLQQVQAAAAAGRFRPLPGNVAAGYRKDPLWLQFTLEWAPGAAPERTLEVPAAYLEDIRMFSSGADGTPDEQRAGALLPKAGSEGRYRQALFHLRAPNPAPADQIQTYYLRIHSRTSLLIEPVLWRPPVFQEAVLRESLLFGGYFGIALIILLGNLIYWARLREPLYLHYAAYVATMTAMSLCLTGYCSLLLTPSAPWVSQLVTGITACLLLGQGVGLFSQVVEFGQRLPRTDRIYRRSAWTLALLGVATSLAGHYFKIAPLQQLLLLAMVGLCGSFSCWLMVRGDRGARLYLLAFGPQIISAVVHVARLLSWLPAHLSTEHILYIGALFHLVLMNLPMAYRVGRFKRELDLSRTEALAAAERHAADLEAKVALRTADLNAEKIQVDQALVRVQGMMEEQQRFLSTLSHEFRTPLSIIDGAAQIVEMAKDRSASRVTNQIGKIRQAVRRLLHLLDNSLHQDRVASGVWAFRPKPIDLASELAVLAERAQGATETHHISLEGPPPPGAFTCDPEWLSIAIQNLLDNAIKYSPGGGDIHLRVRPPEQGAIVLEVADSGIGIPADQLDRVCTRFFRGPNVGSLPGAGLGLYLVQYIVQRHGGQVELVSQVGTGTTVRVHLPWPGLAQANPT